MNTEVTTPPKASAGGPQTYEDCIALIDSVKDSTEPSAQQAVLAKLKGFLVTRMTKSAATKATDGGGSVKKAMESGRGFKPYEPKALPEAPAHATWG